MLFSAAVSRQQTQARSPHFLPTQYHEDAPASLGQNRAIVSINVARSKLINFVGMNYLNDPEKKAAILTSASVRIRA